MTTKCQNCGAPDFNEKEADYQCKGCGFKIIACKELPAIRMMYCEGCGCIYSDCKLHAEDVQKPVKF